MAVSRFDIDSAVDRLFYYSGVGHLMVLPTRPGGSSAATTGVPTDGVQGFAPGAYFQNFKGGPGTSFYINVGTFLSSKWINVDGAMGNGLVTLAATATITALAHAGRTMLLSLAGGFTSTLPAATGTGNIYRFMIGVVSTTGYLISCVGSDVFKGSVQIQVTGDTPGSAVQELSTTGVTLTMNGTTKGGKNIGDWVQIQDILSGVWSITGLLTGSGSLATPFS